VDTSHDIWAENIFDFQDIDAGTGHFSIEEVEEGRARFGFTDEERKVNLNTAPQEVLENLFSQLDLPVELVANLLDWIDPDEDDRNHGRGAEKEYYEHLASPYSPKNAFLEHFEELLHIKGFTPEVMKKLQAVATVYGSGQINLNTARRETFQALGLDSAFYEKVLRWRLGPDGLRGTAEDGIAKGVLDFVTQLEQGEGLSVKEKILLNKYQNYFRVTSTAFHVRIKAMSATGLKKEAVAILAIKKGKDVEVVYWHENE